MTREDAIEILKQDIPYEHDFDLIDAINMAIKALSQEQQSEWERDHEVLKAYADGQESMKPCEDAISRQAAIDCLDGDITLSDNAYMNAYIVKGYIQATINAIKSLPSVSTEKTGHWIDNSRDGYTQYYCSCCRDSKSETSIKSNYCPNCGAKMVESEE